MDDHKKEMLDLVDKNDNIIGEILRSEAHTNSNIFHREVSVIVFDKEGRVLMQKRPTNKVVAPGIWTVSAAGHVDHNTTPEDAAHNELSEELGFDTKLTFKEKILNRSEIESRFIYVYVGIFPGNAKIKIDTAEVDDTQFIHKNDLDKFQKEGNVIGDFSLRLINRYWEIV